MLLYTLALLVKIFILLENVSCGSGDDLVVETKVGTIRGLESSDGKYKMFLGIPYAKVDEDNPFGISKPFPKFSETFDAFQESKICPQVTEFGDTVGTFDCLQLNMYVPNNANQDNRLPVMVWIYGGAFDHGHAGSYVYGEKYLVRHNIILITLNYRVGPYGFMCLDTPEVPGNQGLRDQLLALKWIKRNIGYFGGDPEEVTLAGTSAGGISTRLHLLSPHERFYNKVIIQSGHLNPSRMFLSSDRQMPLNIAKRVGLATDNISEALNYLAKIDPILLINKTFSIYNEPVKFRLCIEKEFIDVEPFIIDYSVNLKIPKANGIKVLMGINAQESLYDNFKKFSDALDIDQTFHELLKSEFDFHEDQLAEIVPLVQGFYLDDNQTAEHLMNKLSDFESDLCFNYPTDRNVKNYLENGVKEVYYYMFSYSGAKNFLQRLYNVNFSTAVHGDEYGYQFSMGFMPEDASPQDQLVIDRMTTMWANFVKYGDPTPETSELLPVKWKPITNDSDRYYLDIGSELRLGTRPYHERLAFWQLFYKTYAAYERTGGRSSATHFSAFGTFEYLLFLHILGLFIKQYIV